MKLPNDDFFKKLNNDELINFGKESRDIAISKLKDFRSVIDIGAHVGISVNHWAQIFDHVYAYEPMLDHYNLLKENTHHLSNVECFNFAISDKSAKLQGAYRTGKNSGSFQIIDNNYTQPSKKSPRQLHEISSHRLDEFVFSNVDLIKIDVEGWELEVLKGAIGTIQTHRPILLIEFTGGQSKKSLHSYNVDEYLELINYLGYQEVARAGDDTIYIPL